MVLNAHFHKWHFWSRSVSVYFNLEWGRSSSRPRPHLVLKSSLSRPHPVLVLSSSPKFEIYLVLVPFWGRARTRTVPGRLVLSYEPLVGATLYLFESVSGKCPEAKWICEKDSEFIVILSYCIQSELESSSEVQTEPGNCRWDSRRFFGWTEGQNSLRFFEFCISRQTGSKLLFLQNLRQDRIKKKLC